MQKPLDMPYKGPYRVIHRTRKYFILDLDGRQDSVSLDRVKPAFIDPSPDDRDDSGSDDADPKLVDTETPELVTAESDRGEFSLVPHTTRSGRTVQTPKRYAT